MSNVTSTTFTEEMLLFKSTYRMFYHIENEVSTRALSEYQQWAEDVSVEPMWEGEMNFMERYSGVGYSLQCTKFIIFTNFVKKWRHAFNSFPDIAPKERLISEIERVIMQVKQNGQEYCGCTDHRRRDIEDEDWDKYMMFGPGIMAEIPNDEGIANGLTFEVWTLTPDVSYDEFETKFYEKMAEWRHSSFDLIENLEDSLAYLKRVPHKNYQGAYFKLSSVIPQSCAGKVLEFL